KVRMAALFLLGQQMHEQPEELYPYGLAGMRDENTMVRSMAVGILGLNVPQHKEALTLLIAALETQKPEKGLFADVICQAYCTLRDLGPKAKGGVPQLIKLLKSADPGVREKAADIIYYIGPDAKDAVPDLVKILEEKKSPTDQIKLRYCVMAALVRIGAEA